MTDDLRLDAALFQKLQNAKLIADNWPEVQTMATREEVTWAYRMSLGRDPESESIIQGHVEKSLPDLRNLILQSEEFRHWGWGRRFRNEEELPRRSQD
jgi:hypothetical protein